MDESGSLERAPGAARPPGAGADPGRALHNPLCVAVGRVQLLRRRRRRGAVDPARVEADLEAVEAALVRLRAVVDGLDRPGDRA